MMGGHLSTADWLSLLLQFMALSLISVSGAIGMVPEMHRFLVDERAWLTEAQFNASVAIAQASPGPNVLFVALFGWNVGINAAGGLDAGYHAWLLGAVGMVTTMAGILVPSGILTYSTARWMQRNRQRRAVRAFRLGMAPVVIGLLAATGWVLTEGAASHGPPWAAWAVAVAAGLMVLCTKLHLLWLLSAGAVIGMLDWM